MTANTLTRVSGEWASRPDDERFTSLPDMLGMMLDVRHQSKAITTSSANLHFRPLENGGLELNGRAEVGYEPTHWAFSQLATLAGAPAGYLRTLPPEMACDCLNYGYLKNRAEDVGILLRANGTRSVRAATGPNYGRVWNSDVVQALIDRFGDGITGDYRVPGEFGKHVEVTQKNTTLYASDRDMFVFLCDEQNRITVPNRRDGKSGDLARGFYVWNSEVGAKTFGLAVFYFDFVCRNRMIWGVEGFKEFSFRHTSSAPYRFLREVEPALNTFLHSSSQPMLNAIEDARSHKLGTDVDKFLQQRFSRGLVESIKTTHKLEEGRPIESRWDVIVGATALARSYEHQDARIDLEREASKLLSVKP